MMAYSPLISDDLIYKRDLISVYALSMPTSFTNHNKCYIYLQFIYLNYFMRFIVAPDIIRHMPYY